MPLQQSTQSKFLDSTSRIFDIMYIVGYSFCILFFLVLLGFHYSLRNAFHPIFSFYIVQFFIGYIICELSVVVHYIIVLSTEDIGHEVLKPIDMTRFVVYSYMLPVVLVSTLERLGATIFVSKYEHMRPWKFVAASEVVCIALVACLTLFVNDGFAYRVRTYMAIAIELCVYIVIIALFLVNRHRIRQRASSNYARLTSRYQLAENIRTCRFLLIFVFIDSAITITDSVMDILFNISTDFDQSRCNDPSYLPMFAVYHTFTILLELTSPCALATIGHASYRNQLKKILGLRDVASNKRFKIWSVLSVKGRQSVGDSTVHTTTTTDQYFSQLANTWERDTMKRDRQKHKKESRPRTTADVRIVQLKQ